MLLRVKPQAVVLFRVVVVVLLLLWMSRMEKSHSCVVPGGMTL